MLNAIIQWSLQNRLIVVIAALVLVIVGCISASDMNVDVLPEFAPTFVIVQTEAPGMVPEEVESLISLPLESALNGTPGVSFVRSNSMPGISNIMVIFDYSTNVYLARQLVNEKLQMVIPRLPTGVGPPTMLPVMATVGDVLKIGLVSKQTSLMDLRTLADWDIRNRLLAVPGVARVLVQGGEQKQFQVLVHPEKLKAYGVTLTQVQTAAQNANVVAAGGFLSTPDTQLMIRGMGRTRKLADLENSVVATREGTPVLLKHVADVRVGPAFKIGDALVSAQPAVELIITKQPGVDTLAVTHRVELAMAELKNSLPPDVQVITVFRQANFIQRSIDNMYEAIITGGILVVVVLIVFLLNWRTAAISLTAIPLSLMTAVLIIKASGGSINTMTLGGLAIAVGEVVDDAIVDVENVYKRLRENAASASPKPAISVIYDACLEVRSSVVYATFIVAMVFIPVFALTGVEGRIFTPLGVSYIIATLSSLLVALTVTPALCMSLLAHQRRPYQHEPFTVERLKDAYRVCLSFILKHSRITIALAVAAMLASFSLLPFMGQAFLPPFREENLIVPATGTPGQSLDATLRIGDAIEKALLNRSDVVAIAQRAGRAEMDDDAGGPHFSEFDIHLKDTGKPLSETLSELRAELHKVPGVVFDIGSFINDRMNDVLSGGIRAPIAIKIFGPDLAELRRLANEVAAVVKDIPGTVDVRPEVQVLVPEVHIQIDREKAARYGLSANDLSLAMQTAFNGQVVSQVLEGQRIFPLNVWFDPASRHNIQVISSTLIDTPSGAKIPLSELATIQIEKGPNTVVREQVARRIVVQANVSGRDVVSVVNEARQAISTKVPMPAGYYLHFAGQYEAQQEASFKLLWTSALSLLAIMLLLFKGLGSWRSTLLVASNLPLAMIGGILAVSLTGSVISIGSMIGFISLFGISTRNSLLLVTHINSSLEEGLPLKEAIMTGSLERVSPVMMTALTAGLGMLPLAVLGGTGRELEQPLAIVIVGGLVTSTALTLLVIPALFLQFGGTRPGVLNTRSVSNLASR